MPFADTAFQILHKAGGWTHTQASAKRLHAPAQPTARAAQILAYNLERMVLVITT